MMLLQVRGLSKHYGGLQAVDDCSFGVEAGEIVGLIGPNGAGKSTVISLVSGFAQPDAGEVFFGGADVTGRPAHMRARGGLVRTFQLARVWGRLSVMENMLVAAAPVTRESLWRQFTQSRRIRAGEEQDRIQAREILQTFGLTRLKDAPADSLSGGQKRLLEFARILMYRPRLVLLDEPSASLSPDMSALIGDSILRLSSEGIAVLLVEHDVELVERTCSRILCMATGRLIAEGSMAELRASDEVVGAYLGTAVSPGGDGPPPGRLVRAAAERPAEPEAAAPLLRASAISAGYGGGDIVKDVTVTVRPGELVALLGPNGAGKSTLLRALVGLVSRTGGQVHLRDTNISNWPTERLIRAGIAYVPQLQNVFPSLTVLENLELGAYAQRSDLRGKAAAMLELFPALQRAARRPAGTLSGGERSLLGLARALMAEPSVLLADEPTAGLSPQYQQVVWEHLAKIRDAGVAVLVVEQNVAQAIRHADRSYVLVLGRIAVEGAGDQLAGDQLAALYIGTNAAAGPTPEPSAADSTGRTP
jgi:branched-chain amino acid transport system ATP-binding protein/branched-chain amino acid transport system permease protein